MRSCSFPMLFLLSLFVTLPILAQITITTEDVVSWYAVGKGMKQPQVFIDTLDVGKASVAPAQMWTFPSINNESTLLRANVNPTSSPYAFKYPMATHAETYSNNAGGSSFTTYDYFRIANDSFSVIGSAHRNIAGAWNDTTFDLHARFKFKMPITLGTTITSRDSNDQGGGIYVLSNSTQSCDAFGTITLPNGTFQSLRMRNVVINETYQIGKPAVLDTSRSFLWLTKEGHQAYVIAWDNSQASGRIHIREVNYSLFTVVPTYLHENQTTVVKTFKLMQNYPNPFNPTTTISFSLPTQSFVSLKVFDLIGREVAILVNEVKAAGNHSRQWNAEELPSGIYFYRLFARPVSGGQRSTFSQTKRLVLLR